MTTTATPSTLTVMTVETVIQNLMADAFPPGRRAYSMIYRHGVESVLEDRLHRTRKLPVLDLRPGGVAYDAFQAGRAEGKEIARRAGLTKALAQGVTRRNMRDLLTRIAHEIGAVPSSQPPISADSYLPAPLVDYLRAVLEQAGGPVPLEPIKPCQVANDQAIADEGGEFRFDLRPTGFAPGEEVIIIATDTPAKVIGYVQTSAHQERVLVDYPHGGGVIRHSLEEWELVARNPGITASREEHHDL